jgi:integrase
MQLAYYSITRSVKVPQVKLNKRFIDKLKTDPPKQVFYWDANLPAFGVLTSAETGKALSYIVQGRIDGRGVRRKVGRVDVLNLADAREEAKRILVGFGAAIDPRQKKEVGATLLDVLEGYLKASTKLKPRSVEFYRDTVTRHFSNWLGMPITSITRDMVERRHLQIAAEVEARDRDDNAERAKRHLHLAERNEQSWPEAAKRHRMRFQAARDREPRSGHGVADGAMRCLRALWNFAADKSPIGTNPVRLKRQWFKSPRRETLVKADDMAKFYAAITELKSPICRDFISLLLFTGLRRREAASLRWTDVDLKARIVRIPASNTKTGKKLDLPMSDFVFDMLTARRALGNTVFVFPANSASGHIEEPKFALDQVASACGVKVSSHDLRRSYITAAESCDISPLALKSLANHAVGNDVTAGYVVMNVERLREAAQRVADRLKELCGMAKPARKKKIAG